MGIYDYDRYLEKAETRIREAGYGQSSKDTIFEYESQLFLDGLSKPRIIKYLSHCHMFATWLDTDIPTATEADIKRVISQIERSDRSIWTKTDYKSIVRRLYTWLGKPELVSWISIKVKKSQTKIPEELLTEGEITRMIEAAITPRDRAIVAVLYDSGCRISEMGNIKIKHIVPDQYGAVITVNGKTGMRRVRLIASVPYLSSWLDIHPHRDNPDMHLWVGNSSNNAGNQLQYHAFRYTIVKLAKKAGIQKRVHNHLFRHSRSTELAQHLTQAQMEEHLGWVHGSNMPSVYIHMSGKQVDNALLKMYGLTKEEDTEPALTPIKCPRCKTMNGPTSKYCSSCRMALTTEAAHEVEDDEQHVMGILKDYIKKHPEKFGELL
ncbi:tyrosine-type recombinase/integrase [Methanolobus sp. ZRKC3]|uniref:tyrosine-type recombinase/integrase n=1 Tax=Methanolobus sp. ZRKC3 TaxID=3125786 RepID=UPI0032455F68